MALIFWTAADSQAIKKSFGAVLKSMKPHIPQHQFVTWDEEDAPPEPEVGDIVLVCGTKPLESMRRVGLVPKNRTVNSLREKPVRCPGKGWYLVTYDPGLLASEPDKIEEMAWDTRLANRLMATGQTAPVVGQYKWVNDYRPMIKWIEDQYDITGEPVDVACDTETETFFPWYEDRDIISISFTAKPGTAEVLYLGPQEHPVELIPDLDLLSQIEWLLNSPKVKLRGSNFKYDLIWIWVKWKLRCTNFKFDNMLVGSLLNENRSNSLNKHCKTYTDMGGYDDSFNTKYDKGKMGEIPANDEYLTYAGGDTDGAQRVADVLRDELLEDPELANFYVTILHPAARAFEKIEIRGVAVDLDEFHKLRDEITKEMAEAENTAMSLLPNKIKLKFRDKIDNQLADGKNPLVPSVLKEYFFSQNGLGLKAKVKTPKTGEPSMAKSHLKMFGNVPDAVEMVKALTTLDTASKTRSTFIDGFLKHLRPDGLLHPTYFLAHGEYEGFDEDDSGTVTGRLSAKNPAFQIIPKKTAYAKRIRKCFPAKKGKVILALDFSQGELRVVACVAPEPTMIQAYEAGLDLHAVTGAKLSEMDLDTFLKMKESEDKEEQAFFALMRDRAKPANFGLLYGMSAEGFQAYAWAAYGLKLTLEEAEVIRNAFFTLYPGLTDYHSKMKALVKLHEMVRSPLGRVRHLPTIKSWDRSVRAEAERQAINSPVQSTLTDMMIWAIALIEDAYPNEEFEIFGMVHDQVLAYVDEDKAQLRAQQAYEIMSNLPFHQVGWEPVLKFPADAEYGPNMADLQKIKIAA